ncbi:preprotein translocase subunit TatB [Catellatospora sp. KI3]|uniref:preprotein translocase subunit TatB n=1 Tax=Catellatospora sp. KI3 TaxID=3041620 RepID=UPI0024825BD8|nr:preprotein translocase subunit TatB [Catellatospora sp. KI3]MDI1460168.1 preprotein translocase subunit TatB [Catellatospora sp. KI3]
MLENLNSWEFIGLLLLALLIFGEKLPKVIQDGLRMLRNLRSMATNATGDLSRELGTDIRIEDLNPKAFVRKHLLSEEDEAALRNPLTGLYSDLRKEVDGVAKSAQETRSSLTAMTTATPSAPVATTAAATPAPRTHNFDDAT